MVKRGKYLLITLCKFMLEAEGGVADHTKYIYSCTGAFGANTQISAIINVMILKDRDTQVTYKGFCTSTIR